MINHRGHREHGVKEFAGGYIKTSEGVVKDRGVGAHLKRHAGAYTGTLIAPVLGTGIGALIDAARKKSNIIKTSELEPAVSDKTAAMLRLRGPVLMSANLKPALRELAARSGRIVEFGDGEADEAVLGALKAVASADESSAQRAMLLKRGLIEMVKGQVVITERGYDMMQKAGVPPKLTPEERREEIAGTEEKRLSRFDHRGHREHRVEFAAGDQILKLGFKAASAKGVHPYEAAAMAQQLHGPILATAMTKKVGKGGLSESYQSLVQRAERNASAHMIREYRGMLRRGAKREFARGDYAIPFLKNALQSMKGQNPPAWAARRSFPPADGYTHLTPIPNPIEEAVNWSGSLKKPSERWSGDLIDPHPIFSGQKRTNPIRKDVAKLIKQIRNNATPSPLSGASYAQAGQERTWGFRF